MNIPSRDLIIDLLQQGANLKYKLKEYKEFKDYYTAFLKVL